MKSKVNRITDKTIELRFEDEKDPVLTVTLLEFTPTELFKLQKIIQNSLFDFCEINKTNIDNPKCL